MGIPRIDRLDMNHLINGNFEFWQRGTTFTVPASTWFFLSYGPDRWFNHSAANTLAVLTQQPSGLSGSPLCARWTAGGVTERFNLAQCLEADYVNRLKGKYVTVSVKARVNVGNVRTYGVIIEKNASANTKTGGAWVSVGSSPFQTLTTSFQILTTTRFIPDDGTANGLKFHIQDNGVGLATDYIEVTDFMVLETINDASRIPNIPDVFVGRGKDNTEEQAYCQRYFEKTYNLDVAPGTVTQQGQIHSNHPGGVNVENYFPCKVSKRVTPAVTFYNPQSGAVGTWRNNTNASNLGMSAVNTGRQGTSYIISTVPSGAPEIVGHIVLDCEI